MTNPNSLARTAASGATDPLDDPGYDWMDWVMAIEFRPPAEVARERAIRQWLEAAGFTEIDLRRVVERGDDCWQAVMRRGTNRDCATGLAAQELMHTLAADLGCRVESEVSGLAWGDQIGVGFRLRAAA